MTSAPLEILLVEDSPHDAELTVRALANHHLSNNLVHLSDGQSALDFLFGAGAFKDRDIRQQPKLVLLDLKLPKLDGGDVLRQIRANDLTRHIPVVMLTSSREDRDIMMSYRLGANSYIVKPVDFEGFLEVVGNMGLYWLHTNVTPNC